MRDRPALSRDTAGATDRRRARGGLFDTAIEQLCDVVSPYHDERVGAVKDVAAAAAGTAMVIWLRVVVLEAVRLIRRAGVRAKAAGGGTAAGRLYVAAARAGR